ncbi:hypothetical protein IFM89_021290 [Coptis chinensis]|uniref:Uncharacterized protein n=1 Tax=Coptis chinensis TaxID=261450 RepID=A0A835LWN2_9MAGN|nr:hypothetical protein IFM89_021290 [Coptis chinensis]
MAVRKKIFRKLVWYFHISKQRHAFLASLKLSTIVKNQARESLFIIIAASRIGMDIGFDRQSGVLTNNGRGWMSKCLTEDAKRYIDDFLSNVEDTYLILHYGESEAAGCSTRSTSLPVEMDGVVLPWLQLKTHTFLYCARVRRKFHGFQIEDISYGSLKVHMMNDANILEAIQLINVDATRHHVLDSLHPFFTLNWSSLLRSPPFPEGYVSPMSEAEKGFEKQQGTETQVPVDPIIDQGPFKRTFGTRLLAIDVVAALGLLQRALLGDELTDKEKQALQTNGTDYALLAFSCFFP